MRKKTCMSAMIPMTPTAMFDVWKLGTMAIEMWSTAIVTINSRTKMWETQSPFDPKMMRENLRMVTEKVAASREVGSAVQKAILSGGRTPWWTTGQRTLQPLHKRTTANSKRLG